MGEASKREILFAAMNEFAEKGLKGARVDDIAAKTRTTKPMIYYHFGSKERLYGAVMEEAYVRVREKEQGLHLDDLSPEQAMQRLVEVTFDHHAAHPDYVRLVCVENMERARHISKRSSLVQRNAVAIENRPDPAGARRARRRLPIGPRPVACAFSHQFLLLHARLQSLHVERRVREGPLGSGRRLASTPTDH